MKNRFELSPSPPPTAISHHHHHHHHHAQQQQQHSPLVVNSPLSQQQSSLAHHHSQQQQQASPFMFSSMNTAAHRSSSMFSQQHNHHHHNSHHYPNFQPSFANYHHQQQLMQQMINNNNNNNNSNGNHSAASSFVVIGGQPSTLSTTTSVIHQQQAHPFASSSSSSLAMNNNNSSMITNTANSNNTATMNTSVITATDSVVAPGIVSVSVASSGANSASNSPTLAIVANTTGVLAKEEKQYKNASEIVMFSVLMIMQFVLFVVSQDFMPNYFTPASVLYLSSATGIIYHLGRLNYNANSVEKSAPTETPAAEADKFMMSSTTMINHRWALRATMKRLNQIRVRIWWISNAGYLMSCTMLLCSSLHLVTTHPEIVVDLSVGIPMMFVSLHALLSAGLCTYLLEFIIGASSKITI